MIVSILAGIALPNLRGTLSDADAAHIVADVSTVRLAAYQYLSENGVFPAGAGFGTVPTQLAPHLADGFKFQYKNVQYAWISFTLPDANNFWGTRTLGVLVILYSGQPLLADAMKSHMGADALWNPSNMFFLFRG